MRVLVVGGGGREHTLTWAISHNPSVEKIYAAPGNAGIAAVAECVPLDVNDTAALARFAADTGIGLTVVGPEAPLVAGVVDVFREKGLPVFGPDRTAAQLEGSKRFAKDLMKKHAIPTGEAVTFDHHDEAARYVKNHETPLVVKADGLAAGKGVTVCFEREQALAALEDCFVKKKFGAAGDVVMVEEYLQGEEVTCMALTDGEAVLPLAPSQDYKPAFDGNKGPNTGGMGSYSPVPVLDRQTFDWIADKILKPTVAALKDEGVTYQGVLYGGIILTKDGPKVLEFNCRFGDPETQVVLPLLKSDLVEVMLALVEGNIGDYHLEWREGACVTVVLASDGYPGSYKTGFEISGLDEAERIEGLTVFHAGTALKDGRIVTAGGRVLNVTAVGNSFGAARERAYQGVDRIKFNCMHYRKDIALRAVKNDG